MDILQFFNTYRIVSSIKFEGGGGELYIYITLWLSLLKSSAGNLSSHSKMSLLFHGSVLCYNAMVP